ncbi:MAG: hypothetical protein ACI4UM_08165, partial [Succinivibrio sp.]
FLDQDYYKKARYLIGHCYESFIPFFTHYTAIYRTLLIILLCSLPFVIRSVITKEAMRLQEVRAEQDFVNICQTNRRSLLVLSFLVSSLLPFYEMETAGFVATTANYFLPLVGTLAICSLIQNGCKISISSFVSLLLLTLFSCNHEQFAVLTFVLSFLHLKNEAKINTRAVLVVILSLASLEFIMTCPGNNLRVASETITWLPEFANFSLIDKVHLGISTTLFHLVYKNNLPFLFCLACLLYAASNRYLIVLAGLVLMALVRMVARSDLKKCDFENIADAQSFFNCFNMQCTLLLFIVASLLVFFALFIRASIYQKISVAILLLLAFALRSVMGFVPTVFSSGVRPAIISQSIFVIVGFASLMVSSVNFRKSYMLITLFASYNFIKFIYHFL